MTVAGRAAPAAGPRAVTSPYRGLLPFAEEDAPYFFGRDADREIIAANLIAARLTLLYAPSGAGKTSVLLAGVARDLRALAREDVGEGRGPEYLPVVVRRWSGDPQAAIDAALAEGAVRALGAVPAGVPEGGPLAERLRGWAEATDTTLLLVLDQFEEFVLYHGTAWERGGAARELADVLSARDLPVNVLLGLREDALASLDRFKGRVPYLFDNYLRLAHLDPAAAREAVCRPLEQWSRDHPDDPVDIEPALVDTLLDEVTTGRIALGRTGAGAAGSRAEGVETPFLQLVLTRLWEEERGRGSRTLRAATLRELGGAGEVVRTHLDLRMSGLSDAQRDIAAEVFHQLVTPSGTKVARSLGDLAAYTGRSVGEIEPVLHTLSQGDWRIVRSVPQAEGTYEVFHDVLAEAVLDWRARHEERRRRARSVRVAVLVGLGAALIVGLSLAFAAWVQHQKEEADRQRGRAEQATRGARSRELAAASQLQFGFAPETAVATAVRAVGADVTPDAMLALRGALAQNDLRGTLRGVRGAVRSLRVSADGRRIAVVGNDHRVRVWRLAAPDRPVVLPGTAGAAETVALSADGGSVAAGGGAAVTVWSLAGPRLRHRMDAPGGRLKSIRWSPANDRLLAYGPGGVRVWSPGTGRVVLDVPGAELAEWSQGGSRLATASPAGAVRVWDADGRLLRTMRGGGPVQTLGFTPDASRVLAVRSDGGVAVLGARGCRARGADVTVAAVARDGRHVALGGGPTVRVLEFPPGQPCRQVELANPEGVNTVALALSADGAVATVATDDGVARVHDVAHGVPLATLFAGWRSRARLALRTGADGGALLFTAGDDGLVRQWQIGALPVAERFGDTRVQAAAIRADGTLVGAAGGRLTAERWEAGEDPQALGSVPDADAAIFDRAGERLAYTTRDGDLLVLDPAGGRRRLGGAGAGRDVTGLAFSADGRRLVTALRTGAAQVWDADTGAALQAIPARRRTTGHAAAAFTADGAVVVADGSVVLHAPGSAPRRLVQGVAVADAPPGGTPLASAAPERLAVALDRASPRTWPDLDGAQAASLDRAGRQVGAVAFSPGGAVIATAGSTGARLLDPATGQALAVLSAGAFDRVAFSPDGRWVLLAGRDRGVQVFPCRPCGDLQVLLTRATAMRALVPVRPVAVRGDGPLAADRDAAPVLGRPAPAASGDPAVPAPPVTAAPEVAIPPLSTPTPSADAPADGTDITSEGGED